MKNSKHTKGEIEIDGNFIFPKGKGYSIAIASNISPINSKFKGNEERDANALLISEAFNVTNKTGLTPSELLIQRDEILDFLKDLDDSCTDPYSNNYIGGTLTKRLESILKK